MSKLFVSIASLGAGGAERVISVLSKPLADCFDEVQYIMWEGGDIFYRLDSRIKIVSLPSLSGKRGRTHQTCVFRRYVKQQQPDMILSLLTPYNMLVLASTIGLRQKIIVAERNDPQYISGGRVMKFLRNVLYRRSVGILAQTEYAKSCFKGSLYNKTTVIYNPVTMDEEYVGRAICSEKKRIFTSIGSLEPKKDQFVMITAFRLFYQSHPDYKLVIYGEGKLRNYLQERIDDIGLHDAVLLPGTSKRVWDEISVSTGFLLSSTHEGMSNAMIEAMCLGLPVITTRVAGSTELINNGVNGFIVDIKDSETMADRMRQLADNPSLQIALGFEAKKVYGLLRADRVCQQWVDYLKAFVYDHV